MIIVHRVQRVPDRGRGRAIYRHPKVLKCAVIGLPDDETGERVKAFVVLKEARPHRRGDHRLGPRPGAGADRVPRPARDRVPRRAARDDDRQGPAPGPAGRRARRPPRPRRRERLAPAVRGRSFRVLRHPGPGVLEEGLLPERCGTWAARWVPTPDRFEAAWTGTALERQTGGFATVEDNVRHICASLGVETDDDMLARSARPSCRAVPDVVLPAPRRARDADGAQGTRLPDRVIEHVRAGRARDVAYVGARPVRRRRGVLQRDRGAQARRGDLPAATDGLGVEPDGCLYCGDGA